MLCDVPGELAATVVSPPLPDIPHPLVQPHALLPYVGRLGSGLVVQGKCHFPKKFTAGFCPMAAKGGGYDVGVLSEGV